MVINRGGLFKEADNATVLWNSKLEEEDQKIDKVWDIVNKEPQMYVPSDIFVALYNDGTLVFSNNENEIDFSQVETYYENIKDYTDEPPWIWNSSIYKVKILNQIKPTTMFKWFSNLFELTEIENIEKINTTNVTNMASLFDTCPNITELDLSTFDTRNVTDMSRMFYTFDDYQSQLDTLVGLNRWDTSKVTNMSSMFQRCKLEEIDVSKFNTRNVTSMYNMFHSCSNLLELDVSKFDTRNVIEFNGMFTECNKLTYINVSNFNTSSAQNLSGMFWGCSGLLEINVSRFNTSNVNNMSYMFVNCSSLMNINISNFDMSKVTDVDGMFNGCSGLTEIYYPDSATIIGERTFSNCTSLENLYIPINVINMRSSSSLSNFGALNLPFAGCNSSTVLYCGASEKPSGWGIYWNNYNSSGKLQANFGYTRAQYEAAINE